MRAINDVRTLAAQRDPELLRVVNNIKKLKVMLGITPEVKHLAA